MTATSSSKQVGDGNVILDNKLQHCTCIEKKKVVGHIQLATTCSFVHFIVFYFLRPWSCDENVLGLCSSPPSPLPPSLVTMAHLDNGENYLHCDISTSINWTLTAKGEKKKKESTKIKKEKEKGIKKKDKRGEKKR